MRQAEIDVIAARLCENQTLTTELPMPSGYPPAVLMRRLLHNTASIAHPDKKLCEAALLLPPGLPKGSYRCEPNCHQCPDMNAPGIISVNAYGRTAAEAFDLSLLQAKNVLGRIKFKNDKTERR